MQQLFGRLGVDTTKLTHELRIFAAQLLYEMGVDLEVRGWSSLAGLIGVAGLRACELEMPGSPDP